MPTTWSTPNAEAEATATEASVTLETSSATNRPTKVEDSVEPSKGAAAGKAVGSWVAFLGLGLGIIF